MDCLPSLLILDNLHLICPAVGDSPENPNGSSSAALVEWLCDVLDSFRPPGKPVLPGKPPKFVLVEFHVSFRQDLYCTTQSDISSTIAFA